MTAAGGYRLDLAPHQVDVTRFEDLVAQAAAALAEPTPGLALSLFDEALSLWRGDVLSDLADFDFVEPIRARLDEMRASALESRIQAKLDLGRHATVIAELAPLVADHPLREGLHAQRILALYRSGRQSDALAAYRELHSVLDAELGIEPSPPLRELNNRVLAQDPTLIWDPPRPQRDSRSPLTHRLPHHSRPDTHRRGPGTTTRGTVSEGGMDGVAPRPPSWPSRSLSPAWRSCDPGPGRTLPTPSPPMPSPSSTSPGRW